MKYQLRLLKKLLGDLWCAFWHFKHWNFFQGSQAHCSRCDRYWEKDHCTSRSFTKDMEKLAEEV